jgi:hypothetical protein
LTASGATITFTNGRRNDKGIPTPLSLTSALSDELRGYANRINWTDYVTVNLTCTVTTQGTYYSTVNVKTFNYGGNHTEPGSASVRPLSNETSKLFRAYCGDLGCRNLYVGDPDDQEGTLVIYGSDSNPALDVHGPALFHDGIKSSLTDLPPTSEYIGYTEMITTDVQNIGATDTWINLQNITLAAGVWRIDGWCLMIGTTSVGVTQLLFGVKKQDDESLVPAHPTSIIISSDNGPVGGPCMAIIVACNTEEPLVQLNYYVKYVSAGNLSIKSTMLITRIA